MYTLTGIKFIPKLTFMGPKQDIVFEMDHAIFDNNDVTVKKETMTMDLEKFTTMINTSLDEFNKKILKDAEDLDKAKAVLKKYFSNMDPYSEFEGGKK